METTKTTATRTKRRWTISWRRLARTAGILLAVELFCTLFLGVGPVRLAAFGLSCAYSAARIGIEDAFVRPKDPGPRPDADAVAAANGFGLRLFSQMTAASPGENVFFSPCSVATGLTMAWNGSAGHTRAAMATALGVDGIPLDDVNTAYARIGAHLAATRPRLQVANAHGLWVDDRARLNPDFARRMADVFGAEAKALDLQAPGAADRVNGWIRAKTRGRIDGVSYRPGPLDRLILADALTFHGKWTHQFRKSRTRPAPFHRLDGTEKTVPMMAQKATVGYIRDAGRSFEAARLPYDDGSMAMYVFVPRAADGLPAFLQSLTPERWEAWLGRFREREIDITIPRFRAEYTGDLGPPLIALGMDGAFGKDPAHPADFSAMAVADTPLNIGQVKHRARLEVDEAGTRADAVTLVLMVSCGRPPGIRADRPFFCAIRDERTGLILFAGAIYDPEPLH